MFDFDKEEQETAETFAPCWAEGEWERITDAHAAQAQGDRTHKNPKIRRRKYTAAIAAHYGILAAGFASIAWLVRIMSGLSIGLAIVALACALVAAYCAGKYCEMGK